ncbi:bifunctional 4-hydroxy-2-oxoglutarate aldolase/2-dehydro-3-deoxy-phosphogluconate aldolase [Viridibacillus sp. FSL R5-0477]|uniref:2-dehydro-3-deoxyphosphogluconate aldolase n=1 Tax=Viridibacillus arenosi FSL R5-213 TaxID=1227360 RepID=W4F552_9BACL|nr:bifunctional 4-hydroxy-2-oxoglutarate aldolase/2-dehydro-3-deoxy-phosphogluconate aldolase [Viridibacillus arenosi]ETT87467.1 2-dehydro-3-deoxyphosphogluconate aldolase [Viridibacillus arenosi FSL R5-213]OMC91270.1 2-dehydro-3-deoxyphosphogluconate aldolase [Viridibacillus arenosi]
MNKEQALLRMKEAGVIPVMRGMETATVIDLLQALYEGGLKAVEITIEGDEGLDSIKVAKEHFQDKLFVGAGTILSGADAQASIDAGADFIVTPIVVADAITVAKENDCFVAIGAFSPTEIATAYSLGADIVKVFPANTLGADYLKNVKGPLPQIPLMPTGGIDLSNIQSYFKNGAICVGVGSAIYKFNTAAEITAAAREYVQAFESAKN